MSILLRYSRLTKIICTECPIFFPINDEIDREHYER